MTSLILSGSYAAAISASILKYFQAVVHRETCVVSSYRAVPCRPRLFDTSVVVFLVVMHTREQFVGGDLALEGLYSVKSWMRILWTRQGDVV